jgi:ADP-heptose:LPS heptosyltransferase
VTRATRRPLDASGEILVLRALALGDLLCTVPFLRALRGLEPHARISLVGLPWAAAFVERFDTYLDALVPFPGWPGIPEVPFDPGRTTRFLRATQARPPDLVIQAHGTGLDLNAFVELLGARDSAGYVLHGRPLPSGTWIPYPGTLPEVRRHLGLAAALGAHTDDERLEWPIRPADEAALAAAVAPDRLEPGTYAVVHPGASRPIRRWPAGRFAAVADRLVELGLRVVLTGVAAEAPDTAAVAGAMRRDRLDLTARTSLAALAALVAGARVVVSNDTGVAHLADALRTPSVRIFRASDPARWAALDGERHVALVPDDLGRRCDRSSEPGHGDCIALGCLEQGAEPAPSHSLVPVAAAVEAVERLLAVGPGAPVAAAASSMHGRVA